MQQSTLPIATGMGLRSQHMGEIANSAPPISYLEVLADNFLTPGGYHLEQLERISENYCLSFHCVGLSIGSVDPINQSYIKQLKHLIERYQPITVSDHLCWTSYSGHHFHDLLPIPFTSACLQHITDKLDQVQNALGKAVIIENVSSYMTFSESQMSEPEFLAELCKRSGCQLLLDINNVYVSATNHSFDPFEYLQCLKSADIAQYHLAGYEEKDGYLLDAHNNRVAAPVWELFAHAIELLGAKPSLIEWDNDIPPLPTLLNEAAKADAYLRDISNRKYLANCRDSSLESASICAS